MRGRARFQSRDVLKRILHFIHLGACAPGDFRNASLAERLHEFTNDPVFEGVLLIERSS